MALQSVKHPVNDADKVDGKRYGLGLVDFVLVDDPEILKNTDHEICL